MTGSRLDADALEQVARDYATEGFEVEVHPGPDSLPEFLSGLRPDIIARRDGQNVVVQVAIGTPVNEAEEVSEVARRIEGHPDWRLDVVHVEPAADPRSTGHDSLQHDEILLHLQAAGELDERGFADAALLIAWSAAEAALRMLALDHGLTIDPTRPRELLRGLATAGVLEQEDYAALMRGFEARNKAAHGFRGGDNRSDLVRYLLRRSEQAQRHGARNPIFSEPPPEETFDLEAGKLYRRIEIHNRFGGTRQGGISVSRDYPFIFLFLGPASYGYDSPPGETVLFTGEGQVGDMQMVRGNQAILEHRQSGKELHLFEYNGPGMVKYLGRYEFTGYHTTAGLDRDGKTRALIVFELGRART
jgi:hypothetical protein